ncbi:MAG: haloacid dehalogenase type II [Thaumarchaeota archaeon]|nr:haloacid dehalogenase type II [Nitrososphaerota archaeon]
MTIREIAFDAYGTLFNVDYVSEGCENQYPGHGKLISQKWRRRQLERTWLLSLMHSYVDFETVTRDALRITLNELNLEYTPKILEDLYSLYLELKPFPEVEGALRELQRSVKLSILSNGTEKMLQELISHTGLDSYFARMMSANAVQIYKPEPRVYELVIRQSKVSAKDEILFVSANVWDTAGSKAFGFKTVRLSRDKHSHFKEWPEFSPDYEIAGLDGLPSIL